MAERGGGEHARTAALASPAGTPPLTLVELEMVQWGGEQGLLCSVHLPSATQQHATCGAGPGRSQLGSAGRAASFCNQAQMMRTELRVVAALAVLLLLQVRPEEDALRSLHALAAPWIHACAALPCGSRGALAHPTPLVAAETQAAAAAAQQCSAGCGAGCQQRGPPLPDLPDALTAVHDKVRSRAADDQLVSVAEILFKSYRNTSDVLAPTAATPALEALALAAAAAEGAPYRGAILLERGKLLEVVVRPEAAQAALELAVALLQKQALPLVQVRSCCAAPCCRCCRW